MKTLCITSGVRIVLIRTFLGAVVFTAGLGSVSAVPVTGDMGLTGVFSANASLDLGTEITLSSVTSTSGTGDIGTTAGFGTTGNINNGLISLAAFAPITGPLTVGG